ncbi:unnamed protein product [Protopolystoma xenopodis]|uniref:Uncharacterized protein n=1 Tax=Protopolystoma xenopodis TaxID=117903 RepID=A0A448WL59_9PLAT|nr:unnamed protein product [Protopolystoma xenopodis]
MRSHFKLDFTDVCRHYFGRTGALISLIFSLISIFGALIVYYILLTSFLYHSGEFIYGGTSAHSRF